jgi:hypothetical protein
MPQTMHLLLKGFSKPVKQQSLVVDRKRSPDGNQPAVASRIAQPAMFRTCSRHAPFAESRGPEQRRGCARLDEIDLLPPLRDAHFLSRTVRKRLIFALVRKGDKKARLMCVHFLAILQ